jgi:hypothetical protein
MARGMPSAPLNGHTKMVDAAMQKIAERRLPSIHSANDIVQSTIALELGSSATDACNIPVRHVQQCGG